MPRFGPPKIERPARPADERGRGTTCWFEVPPDRSSRSGRLPPARVLLVARYRAPAARLASDVHALVPARLAPSRARSVALVGATPLGPRREGGSVHRPPPGP